MDVNTIETAGLINDLKLSRREETVLRALVGRRPPHPTAPRSWRQRGPAIPLEGAKGAIVAAIIIVVGVLAGYLLFLASSKWSGSFPFLDRLNRSRTLRAVLGDLPIYSLAGISTYEVLVLVRLVRKLYSALEDRVGSTTTRGTGQ
jgi:hypothetical protein